MEALLADCSAALKDELCVRGGKRGVREPRRALVVLRGATGGEVAIWVHHGDADISYRELRFGARDPIAERWRAVGLVVASLVLVPERSSNAPSAPESAAQVEGKAPAPARPADSPREAAVERFGVWLGGVAGPWAPDAPWLVGAELGVEAFPTRLPIGVFARAELSQAAGGLPGSSEVARQAWAAGIVTVFPRTGRVRVGLRGQLGRERLSASATNASGEADAGETWRTAGSLALAPSLLLTGRLSGYVGAQLTLYDAEPRLVVAERAVAQASRVVLSSFFGIRVGF